MLLIVCEIVEYVKFVKRIDLKSSQHTHTTVIV